MYIRLDFNNSDYILLFKQDIPAHRHRIIRAYHVELLQKISDSSFPVWPPEEIAEDVYKHFNLYIRKLFSVLNLKIDPDDLTPASRHHFCICTEPVGDSETYRPGLSLLEQLMGFSLKEVPPPDPNTPEYPTTGDEVLDVKVDLFLIFKRHAPKLWESHSLEELALMSRQANERMRDPNQESDKDWIDFKEAMEELPELFVQSKEAVLLKLEQLNICIPHAF
jgi:hypothetical protein